MEISGGKPRTTHKSMYFVRQPPSDSHSRLLVVVSVGFVQLGGGFFCTIGQLYGATEGDSPSFLPRTSSLGKDGDLGTLHYLLLSHMQTPQISSTPCHVLSRMSTNTKHTWRTPLLDVFAFSVLS